MQLDGWNTFEDVSSTEDYLGGFVNFGDMSDQNPKT